MKINLKKLRVVVLTLVMVLLFGTVSTFAYVWQSEPLNDSDPVITVMYERTDSEDLSLPFDQMTVVVSRGDITGVVELNGTLYELNKTYTVSKQVASGHFVSGDQVFDFYKIGEMGPSPVAFYDSESKCVKGYIGQYAYTFELVLSEERPETIMQAQAPEELAAEVITAEDPAASVVEEPAAPENNEGTSSDESAAPATQEKTSEETASEKPVAAPEPAAVTPAKAKIVSLLSKKSSVKVRWNPVRNASAFQIQYSTNKHFKHAKLVTVKSATKKTIKKLRRHRKYYVRVRALNGNEKGRWSKVRVVRTK